MAKGYHCTIRGQMGGNPGTSGDFWSTTHIDPKRNKGCRNEDPVLSANQQSLVDFLRELQTYRGLNGRVRHSAESSETGYKEWSNVIAMCRQQKLYI